MIDIKNHIITIKIYTPKNINVTIIDISDALDIFGNNNKNNIIKIVNFIFNIKF
jgi:hypothetical protein